MKWFEKAKTCWRALREEAEAGAAMEHAIGRFAVGILAGTVAMGWFTMPSRLLMRWAFACQKVAYSIVDGDEAEGAGWLESLAIGTYGDDLIPEAAAKLALAGLAAGTVLLMGWIARRRMSAWGVGVIWLLGGMMALAGDWINLWTETGRIFTDAAWGIAILGVPLGIGMVSAFQQGTRQWFGKAGRQGHPLAFLWHWALGVLALAVPLSLLLGGRVLGVYRKVGISSRDSLTGKGQVLVVENRAETPALCAIEIGDGYCRRFVLGAGGHESFGILETGQFMSAGTTGRLSVRGHRRGIQFAIQENKSMLLSGKLFHTLGKAATKGYEFSGEMPVAFGQKPSKLGGAVVEIRNLDGKETVQGTLSVNGGQATAKLELGPGETKTFGRLELLRALRKGDWVAVTLEGYEGEAVFEVGAEKRVVGTKGRPGEGGQRSAGSGR